MALTTGKTKYFTAKRLAYLAVLTAMGLIMFMVESLFPPLFLPGAKMGLSNVFSLLTLFLLGPTDAFVLVVVRTTLGSMFTGNMSTLLYSLSAGIVSVLVSALLTEFVYPRISIVAISVVSAVLHNLTQNVVFCLISNTPEMFSYMPWLALLGVVAGLIVGFAVWFILRAVPVKTFAAVLGATEQDFCQATEQNPTHNTENNSNDDTETQDKTLSDTDLCDGNSCIDNNSIETQDSSIHNTETQDNIPFDNDLSSVTCIDNNSNETQDNSTQNIKTQDNAPKLCDDEPCSDVDNGNDLKD